MDLRLNLVTLETILWLVEESMVKLDRICRQENVMLIFARSYGLTGLIQISVKEHTVIESKPDHFLYDLRKLISFVFLNSFAESIDLNVQDPVAHKHIPYVVILVKMSDEWKTSHGGTLPSTKEAKREFKELLKSRMAAMDEENYTEAIDASIKVFAPQGISPDLQQIIIDSCADFGTGSSEFWVIVAALKDFIANEGGGEVPLEGLIPDMTSSTECVIDPYKISSIPFL
ncbi:NEDD8-activating enzyme E1 regulatory subunit [Hibiscus syriacus]|uniref:NEDD8-activating enzyme E1 regulatory subunit n=1 Tax=Hibiscus syriacus TaxID=106335 RepID=A0A6A3ALC1_HIBSY|nr:NEDD8-activating enzyme E1 regulatory subunit [Hibiscus syriacus]